jgi:phage tail sheath gpL-like
VPVAKPQLKVKASVSASAVAKQLKIAVPAKAKVTLTVSGASKKICKIASGKLVTLKRGKCSVSVTVQLAKPKGAKKNPKAIKTSRVITIK